MNEQSRRPVAILCASQKTYYRELPALEVYDIDRDARTFPGGMPVIAHPPCRRWTRFGMAMMKARLTRFGIETPPEEVEAERQLGLFCARNVVEWGGILEQPAGSKLFAAAGLPLPGAAHSDNSFSLQVWQSWWGYPVRKQTWLYFRGINQSAIEIPFRLWNPLPGSQWYWYNRGNGSGSANAHIRSMTVPALAEWLVDLARCASVGQESATDLVS
jgi:hypothetical protein